MCKYMYSHCPYDVMIKEDDTPKCRDCKFYDPEYPLEIGVVLE
jgi:hypothetical protein